MFSSMPRPRASPALAMLLLGLSGFCGCSAEHSVKVNLLGSLLEVSLDSVSGSPLEHVSQTLIQSVGTPCPTRVELQDGQGHQVVSDSELEALASGTYPSSASPNKKTNLPSDTTLSATEWYRYYVAVHGVGDDHLCSQSPDNASQWSFFWHEARQDDYVDGLVEKMAGAKPCSELTEAEWDTIPEGPLGGSYAVRAVEDSDGGFSIRPPHGAHMSSELTKLIVGRFITPDVPQRRLESPLFP